MAALSELFGSTRLVVPCSSESSPGGEAALTGKNLSISPLTPLKGVKLSRKLHVPLWFLRNSGTLMKEAIRADAIHAPIPGDVGTFGMLFAFILRKPLFVRHCGNWFVQTTAAEHFWKWFMVRFAGGRNVMIATGGDEHPPSPTNQNVRWIFSTSLTAEQIEQYSVKRQYPSGRLKLVIACRQDKEKGTGVLIESLPEILQTYSNATLDVIGTGASLGDFKALAERLGVQDRVKFWGKLEHGELMRVLRQSDLFCYPTRASEGFPKVVLEALACGLPVVTTRVSVLPQLMSAGGGFVMNELSPAAVAAAVRSVLRDPQQYLAMSEKATATAARFSLEQWRTEIGGLLKAAWGTI